MLPKLFHFKNECPKIKGVYVNVTINASSYLYTQLEFLGFTSAVLLLEEVEMFVAVVAVF